MADIVFLIDISSAMFKQTCIEILAHNIGVLVANLVSPDSYSSPVPVAKVEDWRIKICGYRDATCDGTEWWVENPFTSDISQVRADIAALEVLGGGDEPESLLDGLWKLAKMPYVGEGEEADASTWRHHHDAVRCVIVFTDSTCHMVTFIPEAGGATFDDVAREVMAARLRILLYAPEADCYQSVSSIDKCEWEIVGDMNDGTEKMLAFFHNSAQFKNVIINIAKSVRYASSQVTSGPEEPLPDPDPVAEAHAAFSNLNALAMVSVNNGDFSRADQLLHEMALILDAPLDLGEKFITSARSQLVRLYEKMGRSDDAVRFRDQVD